MSNIFRITWFATLLLTAASLFQCYLVIDRIIAAVWAWYKFKDYGGGGHIMLSLETTSWFIFISFLIWIVGFEIGKRGSILSNKIAKAARWLIVVNLISFLTLAFSPLNQWRV